MNIKFMIQFLFIIFCVGALLNAGDSKTITISAFVYGNWDQPIKQWDGSDQKPFIINGDFLVTSNVASKNYPAGDGIDEFIIWNFEFKSDPDFCEFIMTKKPIVKAILTVVLKRYAGIGNDKSQSFYLQGKCKTFKDLPKHRIPNYEDYPNDKWVVIQYDLLRSHDSEDFLKLLLETKKGVYGKPNSYIFDRLSDTKKGDIPMIFRDDIILRFAALELIK